ncbi:MAG TPA: hypothetical protein VGK19_21750 [Capsulimonadaceae bacterium]|jgi:hypothetical protein
MDRRTSRSKLVRKGVIAVALLLAVAGGTQWYRSQMPVNVHLPKPTVPSPNARDYYTAAGLLLVDRGVVGYAVDSKPIGSATKFGEADALRSKWVPTGRALTLTEKDRLVAENQAALAKLREGMRYSYCDASPASFNTLFPHYSYDRAMARLLSLEGQTLAAHGKWDDAAGAYLDTVKLGGDITKGPVLIGTLVGISCQKVGRLHCYDVVGHLSASTARYNSRRLESIDAAMPDAGEVLAGEERFTQGSLLELFRSRDWRKAFIVGSPGDESQPYSVTATWRLQMESPRVAYDGYTRYMDQSVARARLPWPQQLATSVPPMPDDPLNYWLLPVFARTESLYFRSHALNRLLATQLALRAFYAERNAYPSTLAELAPRYLSRPPLDPFADHAPLKYRRTDHGFVLYSIGPDAQDDGGKPIVAEPKVKSKNPYEMTNDTTLAGDIVAGTNY